MSGCSDQGWGETAFTLFHVGRRYALAHDLQALSVTMLLVLLSEVLDGLVDDGAVAYATLAIAACLFNSTAERCFAYWCLLESLPERPMGCATADFAAPFCHSRSDTLWFSQASIKGVW